MHDQWPPRVRHSLLTTVALTSLAIAAPATSQTAGSTSDPQPGVSPAVAQNTAQQPVTPDQQQEAVPTPIPPPGQAVVITGYRRSLQSSTNAKKRSVGFVDTIFAEDIGKFPDTNIAESFNRIPGITIQREVTGEGLEVSIRGLGANFTRVTLNNAPILIASTGRTDSQNTNREVDLDLFPTELFTKLTVTKSPTAGLLEGGAAGTIDMRSPRPFGNPRTHLVYSAQTSKLSGAGKSGYLWS